MPLQEYRRRRDFARTGEPRGQSSRARKPRAKQAAGLQFVVQKHAARRLHYDFRLELDGVLKSWAVPKGPSLVPGEKRMAVEVEDHPLEYASFEGVIPRGEYGGGTVLVWDRGGWQPIGDPRAGLEKGKLDFRLEGEKLRGRWHLVRMRPRRDERRGARPSWLLIKGADEEARAEAPLDITDAEPRSVLSGRDLDAVAAARERVWSSATGEHDAPSVGAPGDPAAVPGAKRGKLPRAVEPQLATLVDAVPEGDAWLHELKLDGYRLLCRLERGTAQLRTRAGNDWTARFPGLERAIRALPAGSALLDGEAVVLEPGGRSSFQALQRALGSGDRDVRLYLFDLLHLDGHDLRGAALLDRKRVLRQLLARAAPDTPLRYSDHVRGRGPEFLAAACEAGVEGVVSKRADAPYRSGRSRAWLKIKCSKRQEFVVVGFTEPAGSRAGLGALLLGAHDAGGALRYCGKVGTGFSHDELPRLRRELEAIERSRPAVLDAPRARGVHWVEPLRVAEVSFSEWTGDGRVRHPAFLGMREDKRPAEVRIEVPRSPPTGKAPPNESSTRDAAEQAGVRLTHPDRVYWPDAGITKRELAAYYATVAERVLPGLARRPLSLMRCPEGIAGECFYQKHVAKSVPPEVPRVQVRRGEDAYAMVTDLRSLIALVQIGVLELHPWGARADRLDRPDLLIFDLDPDEALPWRRVADLAQAFRGYLAELGLVPFVRTTGGKGLHVVAPLLRRSSWDELKSFAHAVAQNFVREAPAQLTAKMAKRARPGKIFVDYLRNDPDATAVASYSTRARPGAPVAMPIEWSELERSREPLRFALRDAPARLALPDPWAQFEASRRALTRAMLRRVGALE